MERVRARQAVGGTGRHGIWSRWPAWVRVFWVLCAAGYALFLIKSFWFARASTYTEWGGIHPVHGPDKIIVSFRNDDLSVYSNPSLEDSVFMLFKSRGIRQTFAFIPNPAGYIGGAYEQPPRNSKIVDLLRQWEREGSIEFALHGFTHLKNNVGAGEFDGLPAEDQNRMIREGKAILDSTLGANVRMFAPPWNQADERTIEACARAGIDRISSYIGIPPVSGTMALNTNAELFYHPGEIPPVDRVLELARSGSGTRFVNVFYHSRVDFQTPEAFRRVDSLLASFRSDSTVEILSLGEISEQYPNLLLPCSRSGWNIVEAENAMKYAKPYLSVFSKLPVLGEKIRDLERRHEHALEAYWRGSYLSAGIQAGSIVRQSSSWLALGRLVALLAAGIVLGLSLLTHATRRTVLIIYAVAVVPVVLLLSYLAVASQVSPDRAAEVTLLAAVFLGGALLPLPWILKTDSRQIAEP